jgi:predicted DCC family thiol-disulfide oxidoreductase YuxK
MKRLTILYDASCGLCHTLKMWMLQQDTFCELEFLASSSPFARSRYPTLAKVNPTQLIAIDERGAVYRDDRAWIMCLYALRDHRAMALRLAAPTLQPLARRAWALVSRNRKQISGMLALEPEESLRRRISGESEPIGCRQSVEA